MDDRFEFVQLIGKGGSGGVYKAICKVTEQPFCIRRFFSESDEYLEGWEQEFMRVMEQLETIEHPNVVTILEAALDHDGAYTITRYHPSNLLKQAFPYGITVQEFPTFAKHGLAALNALHSAGVIHGQLGYDSFMVSELPDGGRRFVLKDYGLRRIAHILQGLDPSKQPQSDSVFLAPELYDGEEPTAQTDLYMFGQLCYVLLAGCHPIAGHDPEEAAAIHLANDYDSVCQMRKSVPKELSDWVDFMTQPEMARRPKSALEALLALNC